MHLGPLQDTHHKKNRAEKEEERRKSATDRIIAIVAVVTTVAAIASAIATHIDARESLAARIRSVDAQIKTSQVSALLWHST